MSKMKEGTSVMQSKPVTSKPRPRVLTRSRSLALPLGDLDLSLPSDCPGPGKGSGGSGDVLQQNKVQPRTDPKKPMRRQKSLAELFGVVIYKSRVQLQELFARRDKDSSRTRKKEAPSVHGSPQAEAGAIGGAGAGDDAELQFTTEMQGTTGSSEPGGSLEASPGRQGSHPGVHLAPVIPLGPRCSDSELNSRNTSLGALRTRTPEELFCVVRDCSGVERPLSTRSLDTIHGQNLTQSSDSNVSSSSDTNHQLKPGTVFTAKTGLVKCNSDSICSLVLPMPGADGAFPLTKASSDDACFIRRHSPHLLPREGNVTFNTKSKSGNSSPLTSTESLSCVNSIVDWLLVGSIDAAYNEPLLCSLQVEAIVDITNVAPHRVPAEKKIACPCACNKKHFRSKLNLAVDDIEWENIEQHFHDINAFINGWRQRGKRVLVVSYHGKSRAPAIAVQHLMTYFRIPLERALAHVRSRRLQTRINPGFVRALQRLEKRQAEEDALCPPPPPLQDLTPPQPRTAWDEC